MTIPFSFCLQSITLYINRNLIVRISYSYFSSIFFVFASLCKVYAWTQWIPPLQRDLLLKDRFSIVQFHISLQLSTQSKVHPTPPLSQCETRSIIVQFHIGLQRSIIVQYYIGFLKRSPPRIVHLSRSQLSVYAF